MSNHVYALATDLSDGLTRKSWTVLTRAPIGWAAKKASNLPGTGYGGKMRYSLDIELGVVLFWRDQVIMNPGTLHFLECHDNIAQDLIAILPTEEVTGMPVAVKTDVTDQQLARARKYSGKNIQRVAVKHPSSEGAVHQLEHELRALVEEIATHQGDPVRVQYQAEALAQLRTDVEVLRSMVDRLEGHLASASALFRGEIGV